MYKVIGSDAREYGPVSEEVVRRWVAEGRANGDTQAQKEGEPGWRSLSTFPEFANALAAIPTPSTPLAPTTASATVSPAGSAAALGPAAESGAASPYAAPAAAAPAYAAAGAPAVDADALANALLAREVHFDVTRCISRGWDLVQKNFWMSIGAWAVCVLVAFGASSIPYVGPALGLLFGAAMLAGLHWFYLRLLRGEPATIGDVFAGFGPALGQLVLIGVVSSVLQGVAFCFLVLPWVYLVVAWHYAPVTALDKKLDFWGAMEVSRRVVTRRWFSVFGLFLIAILLWIAGLLLCGIGVFVTGPIATAAIACAYAELFDAGPPKPSVTS